MMATLSRNQVFLDSFSAERTGQQMVKQTLQVTKTATMTHGTLLLADFTEAAGTDLAANAVYVIDDFLIDSVETGDEATVAAIDFTIAGSKSNVLLRGSELRLGATALTPTQLTTFAVKYQ